MSDLLLSYAERERFASWLERSAATSDGLVEQTKKLPGPTMHVLQERLECEALAMRVVARMLRATEDMAASSPKETPS